MRKISNVILIIVMLFTVSCATKPVVKNGEDAANGKKKKNENVHLNRLKGTNTEIMNAFKNLLARYEYDEFSMASLRIVTKIKKLTEENPYYAKHKKNVDLYEKYEIIIKREGYDAVVNIKYSILVQEMNMKTNVLGFKEVAREKEEEMALLKKVRRLLYGA